MHARAHRSLVWIALSLIACAGKSTVDPHPATGGSGGGAGTTGTGGSSGGASCGQATVTFRVVGGGHPGTTFCIGAYCSNAWLSLRGTDGTPLLLSSECSVLCDGCVATGCSGECPAPYLLDSSGESSSWDGTYFSLTGTCEGGACLEPGCALSGTPLVATMCAYRQADYATTCADGPTPTCVDTAFVFGVDEEVVGVLDPTK